MRLPFGLGRRSGSADGATGDGSSAPASAGAAAGAVAPASVPTRAWASLPAIQRTTGDMPLVAAPSHFVEALPGSHGLPPIVEPLGHEVSPLATPGLVVARTRAVEAAAPGPIPVPAPIQRRASKGASDVAVVGAAFDGWEDLSVPEPAASAGIAAPAASPATAPASTPAMAPIRTMPTVSRQAIRVPDRPLTSAAAASQPAPVQRASAGVAGAGTPATGTSALPRPSGGMRRVPTPTAPVQVSREVVDHRPEAAAPPAATPSPALPSAGTRRGLGEPLTAPPASAKPVASVMAGPVVSRATTSGPLPIAASSLRPVAQRSAAGGDGPLALGPGHDAAMARTPAAALPQPVLRLPHLPVSRSTDDGAQADPLAASPAGPPPVARGPEIRPTAGANPLRPSLGIQRAAADDPDDGDGDAELPSPWWSPAAPTPSPAPARLAGAHEAPGGQPAGTSTLQRSAAGGSGASIARAIAPGRADRGTHAVAPGRSAPVAAPVQRTIAQATRPGPLPQPAGAGMRATSSAVVRSEAGIGPTVTSGPGGGLGAAPVVQTSPATPAASQSAPHVPAGGVAYVQREEGSAPVAPAQTATPAPSERDLDELAQALFGRIRGRLRNDLIYDREAKGLTFDNV